MAILSTEAIIKRPVVVDDMIGIRSMMNLSLSIDHRALDGLAAARFLQQVKALARGRQRQLAALLRREVEQASEHRPQWRGCALPHAESRSRAM